MFTTKNWRAFTLCAGLGTAVPLTAHTVLIENTYGHSPIRPGPEAHFHIDTSSGMAVVQIFASPQYVLSTQTWRIGATYEPQNK